MTVKGKKYQAAAKGMDGTKRYGLDALPYTEQAIPEICWLNHLIIGYPTSVYGFFPKSGREILQNCWTNLQNAFIVNLLKTPNLAGLSLHQKRGKLEFTLPLCPWGSSPGKRFH